MTAVEPLAFLDDRERFLPVPTPLILQCVLQDPRFSDTERGQLKTLFFMTQARFRFEFLEAIEQMKILYDPFDPDRDTLPLRELPEEEREEQAAKLREGFRKLLLDGNYVELSREELVACLELDSFCGLSIGVELDQYKDLHVFYRGLGEEERPNRFGFLPWREKARKVRVFKRVALLVRTAEEGEDVIYMKLFKDVVLEDLKMLTPRVQIQMPVLAKLKIGSTVAGGLFAPALKLLTAVFNIWLFGIILGGCILAFMKGVFSFLSSKTKYMQTLSSSLYFQNLANNVSALTRLVDAAEAEEAKEMLLAYFILYTERDRDYTMEELDQRVEQWLFEQFDERVDFEVGDAVRKLIEKDLMVERVVGPAAAAGPAPRGVLKVYDLTTTLRRLDEWWDNYFMANNNSDPANDRLADGDWPPQHK
jgi:hypothetical protein